MQNHSVWSRFQVPFFFSLSPPVLRRVHARENVIKRFLSFEIPLSCMPMIRRGEIAAGNYRYSFISLLRISKDFEFLQHHVHILCTIVKTGCENLWKTWRMKMMMYDWKWYKVSLFFFFLFFFFLMRDSSILFTLILRKPCFYRDIVVR